MGLHRTDSTRIESVRIATRVKLAARSKEDPAPTIADILVDAKILDEFYRTGNTPTDNQQGASA